MKILNTEGGENEEQVRLGLTLTEQPTFSFARGEPALSFLLLQDRKYFTPNWTLQFIQEVNVAQLYFPTTQFLYVLQEMTPLVNNGKEFLKNQTGSLTTLAVNAPHPEDVPP